MKIPQRILFIRRYYKFAKEFKAFEEMIDGVETRLTQRIHTTIEFSTNYLR